MRTCFLVVCLVLVRIVSAQRIEIAVQKGHSGDIVAVAFNDDGTLLASAGTDHLIKLWHVPTGREMASFSGTLASRATKVEFVENGDFLIVSYEEGSVEKWNIVTSSLAGVSKAADQENPGTYTAKDGSYKIEIEKFYVRRRSLPSGKTVFSKVPIDISKKFNAIAVSESFKIILAANEDASVYAYQLGNGKNLGMLDGHYSSVNAVCFSSNNLLFATASSDRSIIVWNTKTLQPLKRLFGKSFRYETLRFNHAGTQLAVGDELGFGRIIDLQSSRISVSVARWHDQRISALRFSSGDSLVYSAGYDNRLCVYNLYSRKIVSKSVYKNYISAGDFLLKKLGVYREPYAWINAVDISPGGNVLAMGGAWRESTVRSAPQPLALKRLNGPGAKVVSAHPGGISDVLFLSDDNVVSVASNQLVNWRYDDKLKNIYFRDKTLPGSEVLKIIRGPGNTVLLQCANGLVYYDVEREVVLDSIRVKQTITAVTLNPVTGQVVYAASNALVFTNLSTWHAEKKIIPAAHSDKITSIDFNPARPVLATCSWDATVKLWDADSMKLIATVISIGSNDHIIITPDNYYYGTKNSLNGIGFKYGKVFISPEQYDLRFNRPDIILARIGYVSAPIVRSFNRAYLKRLQKMDFTEEMLGEEIHMPVIEFESEKLPLNSTADHVQFAVSASDSKYKLDRINVFVNNVPLYGLNGISLREQDLSEFSRTIELKLSSGRNKIQVSCMNEKGVESLLQTAEITYHPPKVTRPNLYLAVISVSRYASSSMNLKYARKDGQDVVTLFKRSGWFENVFIDTLFDQRATLENIHQLRKFFLKAGTDDEVLFFVSGHGLLDQNLDFYFGTHDIDFKDPSKRGLRYEELEGLLDGIAARKKVLLIDACHSGEVDKSRIQSAQLTADLGKNHKGTVTSYTYPSDVETDNYKVGITTSFELMQEVFANVSKGSGAIVISAAAGNSYALESDEWKNGVFTFSLLSGLKDKDADKNHDRTITVTELKSFISDEVETLTKGAQRPTSRSENLEFDFRVW